MNIFFFFLRLREMLFLQFLFFQLIFLSSSSELLNRQRTSISASQRNERIKRLFAVKSSKPTVNHKASPDRNLASSKDKDRQASSQNTTEGIQQHLSEISRILSKKADDYYGILGVSLHASEDSIIQQYRKLSLLVHPDKIKARGALEATQRVNKARDELMKPFHNRDQSVN